MTTNTTFLPSAKFFPEDIDRLRKELTLSYSDTAAAVNNRDIAIYSTNFQACGQKYFIPNASNANSDVGRICFDIPSILNGVTTVAHGQTLRPTSVFTRIYGTGTNPSTLYIPIPYVNVAVPANGIQLSVNATNIILTTTSADYTAFRAIIVLEYIT